MGEFKDVFEDNDVEGNGEDDEETSAPLKGKQKRKRKPKNRKKVKLRWDSIILKVKKAKKNIFPKILFLL